MKMSKSKKTNHQSQQLEAAELEFAHLDEREVWDILDPGDQSFWEEFFRLEEIVEVSDELDPPTFAITIQNLQTGELRTFSKIKLKPSLKKLLG
jgi:hypothetical protein